MHVISLLNLTSSYLEISVSTSIGAGAGAGVAAGTGVGVGAGVEGVGELAAAGVTVEVATSVLTGSCDEDATLAGEAGFGGNDG